MDNSLSESARFAVYREKLKGICEANNLSYVFIKNAYPIKLVIRPLGGVGEHTLTASSLKSWRLTF